MPSQKSELITLKVEPALAEIVNRMPNKSEFIRNAILGALDNTCPLCQGTGVLSPEQKEHWKSFTVHHHLQTCGKCSAVYLECDASKCPPRQSPLRRGAPR